MAVIDENPVDKLYVVRAEQHDGTRELWIPPHKDKSKAEEIAKGWRNLGIYRDVWVDPVKY